MSWCSPRCNVGAGLHPAWAHGAMRAGPAQMCMARPECARGGPWHFLEAGQIPKGRELMWFENLWGLGYQGGRQGPREVEFGAPLWL